jgi:hypothetical protein
MSVSTLNAGAYLITGFAADADQKQDNQTIVPFAAPINSSFIVKRAAYDQMVSGRRVGQGNKQTVWTFSLFTFGMETVFYGLYDDPDVSQAVTIKTYDQRNIMRYLQCFAAPFNEWFDNAKPIQGGYTGISIALTGGTEIT